MSTTKNTRYHGDEESNFRRAEASLSAGLEAGRLTQSDADVIRKFTRRMKANISPGRYAKIISMLASVRRYFPCQYVDVDEDAYLDGLVAMKYAKHLEGKNKGQPYTQNTVADWMKITKRFFRYLSQQGLTSVPLDAIEGTKTGGYDRHTKTEEDVLTADEIGRIIECCKTPKYKAFFGMLYETGGRSIELSNLRWKDLTFYQWGVEVKLTDYKAGTNPIIRTIPVITYARYLSSWKSVYSAGDPSGDAFVFVTPSGLPMEYKAISKTLSKFVKQAGIVDKTVTLHRFRHSRITHALREGMSETLVKMAFWGSVNTEMIGTYSHLTQNDITDEFMRIAGVEVEHKEVNESPKPVQCVRCFTVSPPGTRFCPVCGNPLSGQAIEKRDDAIQLLERLISDMTDAEKLTLFSKLSE